MYVCVKCWNWVSIFFSLYSLSLFLVVSFPLYLSVCIFKCKCINSGNVYIYIYKNNIESLCTHNDHSVEVYLFPIYRLHLYAVCSVTCQLIWSYSFHWAIKSSIYNRDIHTLHIYIYINTHALVLSCVFFRAADIKSTC